MNLSSPLREKIRNGTPVIGTWMQIPHPIVGEILAQTGLDFILIDGEHAPMPTSTLPDLLPGLEKHGMASIYRVASNRPEYIKAALDSGATGVMVPMVNTAAEAAEAVAAAKYPPTGKRGIGAWRASDYFQNEAQYRAQANETSLVIIQVETVEALENLDAIASTPGVDVVYIGPGDLALSMGTKPGALDERLRAACSQTARAARNHNIASGIDVNRAEYLEEYISLGIRFFTYGFVSGFILKGGKETVQALKNATSRASA
jgi:2-keto-3-deoxy-L-rhamnonate aldolase RhmA